MVGRVSETNFAELADDYEESQATLGEYGTSTPTRVAVVSKVDEADRQMVDEWLPSLGMPEEILSKFHRRRSEYRRNSAVDDPHNRAYDELDLDSLYREYVQESTNVQRTINQLVERVKSGEEITLVCFEGDDERCHRHLLQQMITSRLEYSYSVPVTQ